MMRDRFCHATGKDLGERIGDHAVMGVQTRLPLRGCGSDRAVGAVAAVVLARSRLLASTSRGDLAGPPRQRCARYPRVARSSAASARCVRRDGSGTTWENNAPAAKWFVLEWRPVRGRSELKFAAHANRRSEPSLCGVDSVEADLLVKALGRPGCHLETLGALS